MLPSNLYITPFFGLNYIFDISYGAFSLIISIVYLVLLEFFIDFRKKEKRYIVAKISNKLGH